MVRTILSDPIWEKMKEQIYATGMHVTENTRLRIEAILWRLRTVLVIVALSFQHVERQFRYVNTFLIASRQPEREVVFLHLHRILFPEPLFYMRQE